MCVNHENLLQKFVLYILNNRNYLTHNSNIKPYQFYQNE